MPDLFARDVDHPRGRLHRLVLNDGDAARVDALPIGGLRVDPSGRVTCGPLSGTSELVASEGRRFRVRRASCGLPSCGCSFEFWPAGRRRPVPEPDWAHAETWSDGDDPEIVGCQCGSLSELDKLWPKGASS